ncbi:hypothetical protein A3A71_00415 [Candidatus Berkelbacteria bacterium RIFCSPLOWO2_01_FULL_50_28]|uniref:Uncharacterized protein n=1 Tax=Candidatus Berkelbacteria bacterium RIFCSPLOWO2_01_FULL_50_28 TaxID=1797471 RepID=A0A1F5EB43_9BACT|nr:MAG: hypothetical protein A2807_01170 [Candidatus Berkelbacteria bacterium RIFCSPHIGHO2_01_FULL_50_36]OGD63562.1 MAG: hypothetical protein A3F39_02565 [Candidatus Berkelbacteria bacterium RIFCSPHIGHO2_12_FULL_50_11]OGD64510.1 MAG: hypothetical protein A3A71_00415 [Candidatus Berkelbacteria bacterium RIFCSPLOWO2_01_FULL_50_28]
MSGRFWFYSGFLIVATGLLVWNSALKSRIAAEEVQITNASAQERIASLKEYATRQTNARKLVSLAKKLRFEDPAVLRPLIDRAYELNPNSRDITLLASYYRPELKERVKELDPLWNGQ